jgi:hypothetical protein
MAKIQERLPAIPGKELERVAAGCAQLTATIIEDADHLFTKNERIAAYIHCRDTVADLMKYVARTDAAEPDLVELHASLGLLRAMLHEHGLVRADDDYRGLECT